MPNLNQFDTESLLGVALNEKESLQKRASALGVLLYEMHYAYSALSNDKLGYFQINISNTLETISSKDKIHFIQTLKDLINYCMSDSLSKKESPESGARDEHPTIEPELYERIYTAFGRLTMLNEGFDLDRSYEEIQKEEVKTFLALNGIKKSSLLPFIEELEYNGK
jgi:hypothetical protein